MNISKLITDGGITKYYYGDKLHNPHGPAVKCNKRKYASYRLNHKEHNIVGPNRIDVNTKEYSINHYKISSIYNG